MDEEEIVEPTRLMPKEINPVLAWLFNVAIVIVIFIAITEAIDVEAAIGLMVGCWYGRNSKD
jgi:hypothetical protein